MAAHGLSDLGSTITMSKSEYEDLIRDSEKLRNVKKCLSDKRSFDILSIMKILDVEIDEADIELSGMRILVESDLNKITDPRV